jgi:hypothetical protein
VPHALGMNTEQLTDDLPPNPWRTRFSEH